MTACARQQDADTLATEPLPLFSNLVHFQTDFRLIGRAFAANGFRIDTGQDADPALRDRMSPDRPQHRVPPFHRSPLPLNQWRINGSPSGSFKKNFEHNILHPAIFGLQLVERPRIQVMLPAQRRRRQSVLRYKRSLIVCLTLEPCSLSHPDNLRFGETIFSSSGLLLQVRQTIHQTEGGFRGLPATPKRTPICDLFDSISDQWTSAALLHR